MYTEPKKQNKTKKGTDEEEVLNLMYSFIQLFIHAA